jgi:DNA-binding MarR family transcriptional regulator
MTEQLTPDTDMVGGTPQPDQGMVASKKRQARPANFRTRGAATSRDASDAVDYEALARFRYELRKFQEFSKAAANKAGLTPQQHQALLTIRGFSSSDPVSVGDLAEFLLIRHHTAVELVDRMTKLGLLSRSVDEADGRRVLVKLTREGQSRLRKLSRIHLEELRAIGPTLTKILKPFRRR